MLLYRFLIGQQIINRELDIIFFQKFNIFLMIDKNFFFHELHKPVFVRSWWHRRNIFTFSAKSNNFVVPLYSLEQIISLEVVNDTYMIDVLSTLTSKRMSKFNSLNLFWCNLTNFKHELDLAIMFVFHFYLIGVILVLCSHVVWHVRWFSY